MPSLIVILGMIVLALRVLWDGRIPVSMTHAATGVRVTIFGIVLLIAAPAAFAIVAPLVAAGQRGLNSFERPTMPMEGSSLLCWVCRLLPCGCLPLRAFAHLAYFV